MQLKIKKLHPAAIVPQYATAGAACFDLCATPAGDIPSGWMIGGAGDSAVIGTGLAFEVPDGYMLQVRSRSGLAFKHGTEAFHGTIDSDYRGELMVKLTNHGLLPVRINRGDRIAQACLVKVPRADLVEVDDLTDTQRGAGGFGSTGK